MSIHIKAQFKEIARRLVSRDRSATKNGYSNNLPGDIATALVAAYKLGLEHAENPPEPPKPLIHGDALIWETVPTTSRNILSALTYSYSAQLQTPTFQSAQLAPYVDDSTKRERWLKVDSDGEAKVGDRSFAKKGIGPLLRLGLLVVDPAQGGRLCLTSKGDATCREYWLRSDRDDPSLPIQSMRG